MSIAWSAGPPVNRYFADESLPRREGAALRAFMRRDPRAWVSFALNLAAVAGVLLVFYVQTPLKDHPVVGHNVALTCLLVFGLMSLVSYAWWEWSIASHARKIVATQAKVGALLTSSFGPRALRVTTPDFSYEIPYASVAQVVRFGDVLVVKPNNHLIMALPMELVPPRDLALIQSKVANRPVREASRS